MRKWTSKADFIRKHINKSVAEILALAKVEGIDTTESYIRYLKWHEKATRRAKHANKALKSKARFILLYGRGITETQICKEGKAVGLTFSEAYVRRVRNREDAKFNAALARVGKNSPAASEPRKTTGDKELKNALVDEAVKFLPTIVSKLNPKTEENLAKRDLIEAAMVLSVARAISILKTIQNA